MSDLQLPDRLVQLRSRWEADPASRIFLQLAEEYRHLGRVYDALTVLETGLKEHPGYLAALHDPALREVTESWMLTSRSVLERFTEGHPHAAQEAPLNADVDADV